MGYPFDEDEDYGDNGSTIFDSGGVDLSSLDLSQLNLGNMVGQLDDLINFDPELLSGFAKLFPEDYKVLQGILSSNRVEDDTTVFDKSKTDPLDRVEDDTTVFDKSKTGAEGAGFPGEGIKSGVKEWDDAAKKAGVELTTPPDGNKSSSILKQLADALGLSEDTLKNLLLGGAGLLGAKVSYDDAKQARKDAMGGAAAVGGARQAVRAPGGTYYTKAAEGGIMSLDMAKGRYLDGSTDGMEDKVPAHIDGRRPAALSDGEFVIPADVVSHLGNGNSNAGAKRLYKMMDDVRAARTGTTKQGKQIDAKKFTGGLASFAEGGTVADQYGRKLTRANYEGGVDRQGIPDNDDDPFNYNPNAFKYTTQNNELFLRPASNTLDESVRANLLAEDPTGELKLIEKAYSAMPRDQIGNVMDQLKAKYYWDTSGAQSAYESGLGGAPDYDKAYVMASENPVLPYATLPSVISYMPGRGVSDVIDASFLGYVDKDPKKNLQTALDLVPYFQYARLNNLDPIQDDKKIAKGLRESNDPRIKNRYSLDNPYNFDFYDKGYFNRG